MEVDDGHTHMRPPNIDVFREKRTLTWMPSVRGILLVGVVDAPFGGAVTWPQCSTFYWGTMHWSST